MTSVYVFGVIIAVLFVAGLVVAPWVEEEPADPNAADGEVPPEERRDAALDALQELEFEHETGKLSDDDYHRLRNRYARAAVAARDEASRRGGSAAGEGPGERAGAGSDGGEEDGTAGGAADFCPECGAEAGDGARYCARCGTRLPA